MIEHYGRGYGSIISAYLYKRKLLTSQRLTGDGRIHSMENNKGTAIFNRNQIKYILILAMLTDHIAWSFVPFMSPLGQTMHIIGRLTGPGMSLLLAEGYQYTRDRKKYALRLFIFAMITWIPYSIHSHETWPFFGMDMFGMIFTLWVSFMTIWMWDEFKAKKVLKVLLVVAGCALSLLGDWCIWAVLWSLFAYIYRDDPKNKWISFSIVAVVETCLSMVMSGSVARGLFQLGAFLVPILLTYFYNGKPGSRKPFHKWFFYVFYPLHLLVIHLVVMYIRTHP